MNTRTMEWVESVLSAVDGLLQSTRLGDAAAHEWVGAAIDSRADCAGRIFFAIRGENTDGHRYVDAAFAAGAVAVVVEAGKTADALSSTDIPHLVVRSSVEALQAAARAYRRTLDARVVAVTGSAGKTTSKEYIRAVLRTRYRVHCNAGNYNSLIGVPLTVLEADPDCEYLVSEVGANRTGEVAFLSELILPDVGVITNVGDAHVGYFGSRDAIAAAKGELLDPIQASGVALLPLGDDYFEALRDRARCRVMTFGAAAADFALSDVVQEGRRLRFEVNGTPVDMSALGRYNATNACAAFAVGEVCGVAPETIAAALGAAGSMPGRGRAHECGGVLIVDESYNASPASMLLSLSMLAGIDGASRRIAVLGDMKELGTATRERHERVGRHAAGLGLDAIWWVGEEASHVERGLDGACSFEAFDDVDAAVAAGRARIVAGDAVLVKASRACRLDVFVREMIRHLDEGQAD